MTYNPREHWDNFGPRSTPGTGESPGNFGDYKLPLWSSAPQWWEFMAPAMTALDIGSGTGMQVGRLAERLVRAIGVDISRALLRIALENCRHHGIHNAAFVQWDGRTLPFHNAAFDRVTTNTVLQHVVDDEALEQIVGEAARVLKPGGLLLTSELVGPLKSIQTAPHVRLRSVALYSTLARRHGLDLVSAPNDASFLTTLQSVSGVFKMWRAGRITAAADNVAAATPVTRSDVPAEANGLPLLTKVVSGIAFCVNPVLRLPALNRWFVGQADMVFRKV